MERYFQQAILAAELNQVRAHQTKLAGMVVLPRADASLVWEAVVFVQDGPFAPGPFKFRMIMADDFPASHAPPVVRFQSSVFHPAVDPVTNELNLGPNFKTWHSPWASADGQDNAGSISIGSATSSDGPDASKADWLWHVLLHVKHIFNVATTVETLTDSATVNHDASSLLKSDAGVFELKAAESVRESGTELYSADADSIEIRFSKWRKDLHKPILDAALEGSYNQDEEPPESGLSWAASGLSFARGSD